jgi:pilus assembly protein CpaF
VARLSDGSRKVIRITEIAGMEGDAVLVQDLFEFVQTGTGPNGKVTGHFRNTGTRSIYTERIESVGLRLERFPAQPEAS